MSGRAVAKLASGRVAPLDPLVVCPLLQQGATAETAEAPLATAAPWSAISALQGRHDERLPLDK